MSVEYKRIENTIGKLGYYLSDHKCICVSVSGGADSDIIVHLICTYFRQYLSKIHFVFANTGIEYRATLQHLDYLQERYGIQIVEVRGMPIPVAVKKYGTPFISKIFAEYIGRLQKHRFTWEDGSMPDLWARFPKAKVAIRFWTNDWGERSRYSINRVKWLKEFLMFKKPTVPISSMCCLKSKEGPLLKYQKSVKADLYISGERKAEGGVRAGSHTDCFERAKKAKIDHYMPLWFWNDETKAYYKTHERIKNSDCYEKYGLRRTGCVGCPFGLDLWEELGIMAKYEPQCFKLCNHVFRESYELRKEFDDFRLKCKTNEKISKQQKGETK